MHTYLHGCSSSTVSHSFRRVLGPTSEVVFRTAGRHTCLVTRVLCPRHFSPHANMVICIFLSWSQVLQALTVLPVKESGACFQVRRGPGSGRRPQKAHTQPSARTSEDVHGRSLRVCRVSRRLQCLLRGAPMGRKHQVQDVPRCLVGDQDACSVHMHPSTFASCCLHVITLGVAGGIQDIFSDPTLRGSKHSWGHRGDRVR